MTQILDKDQKASHVPKIADTGMMVKQFGLVKRSCGYQMKSLKQFCLSTEMVIFFE